MDNDTNIGLLLAGEDVESLDLGGDVFGDFFGTIIEKLISYIEDSTTTLEYLSLEEANIEPRDLIEIFDMLKSNVVLKSLDISGVISNENYDTFFIGPTLKNNKGLITLNLSDNMFSTTQINDMFQGLAENTCLKTIILKRLPKKLEWGAHFRFMIEKNKSLTTINLSDNAMTLSCLENICAGLTKNYSVVSLKLNNCSIDCKGLNAICNMLLINSTIKALYLEGNVIGNIEIKILGDMLRKNKGLEILSLGYNKITDNDVKYLEEGIRKNIYIHIISFCSNNVSSEKEKSLEDLVADLEGRKKRLEKIFENKRKRE